MAHKNEAYKNVIAELKDKIRQHGSSRLNRKPDEEEEDKRELSEDDDAEDGDPPDNTFGSCQKCGNMLDEHGNCPACPIID